MGILASRVLPKVASGITYNTPFEGYALNPALAIFLL